MNSDLLIFLQRSQMSRFPESFTVMKEAAPGASLTDGKQTTRPFLTDSETGSDSEKQDGSPSKRKGRIASAFFFVHSPCTFFSDYLLELALRMPISWFTFKSRIFLCCCVVFRLRWPGNLLTVSIGTSFARVTAVAKVCLAVWNVIFFLI
jgi:hypothetical protein